MQVKCATFQLPAFWNQSTFRSHLLAPAQHMAGQTFWVKSCTPGRERSLSFCPPVQNFIYFFSSVSVDSFCEESPCLKKTKKHSYKAWNSGTGIEKRKRRFPLSAFASKLYLWDSHWNLGYSLPSSLCLAWSLCSHWNEKLQATVLNDFRLIEVILTSLKAICSFLRFTSPRCA